MRLTTSLLQIILSITSASNIVPLIYEDVDNIRSNLYGFWPNDDVSGQMAEFENIKTPAYIVRENPTRTVFRKNITSLLIYRPPNPFGYVKAALSVRRGIPRFKIQTPVYMTDWETRRKSDHGKVDSMHRWGDTGVTVAGYFRFGYGQFWDWSWEPPYSGPFRIGRDFAFYDKFDNTTLDKVHIEFNSKPPLDIHQVDRYPFGLSMRADNSVGSSSRYEAPETAVKVILTNRVWTFFAYTYSPATKEQSLYVYDSATWIHSQKLSKGIDPLNWQGGVGLGTASKSSDGASSFVVYDKALSQVQIARLPCLLRFRGSCSADKLAMFYKRAVFAPDGLKSFYTMQIQAPVFDAVTGLEPRKRSNRAMGDYALPFFAELMVPRNDGDYVFEFEHDRQHFETAGHSFTLTFYVLCSMNTSSNFAYETLIDWPPLKIEIEPRNCSYLRFRSDFVTKEEQFLVNDKARPTELITWRYFALIYNNTDKVLTLFNRKGWPQTSKFLTNEDLPTKGQDFSCEKSNIVKIGPKTPFSRVTVSCLAIFDRALSQEEVLLHECNCPGLNNVVTPNFLYNWAYDDSCKRLDTLGWQQAVNPFFQPAWIPYPLHRDMTSDGYSAYFPLAINTGLLDITRRYGFNTKAHKAQPQILLHEVVPVMEGPLPNVTSSSYSFKGYRKGQQYAEDGYFIEFPFHLSGIGYFYGATISLFYYYSGKSKINRLLISIDQGRNETFGEVSLSLWAINDVIVVRAPDDEVVLDREKLAPDAWNFVAVTVHINYVVQYAMDGQIRDIRMWRIEDDVWNADLRRSIHLGPWAENEKMACVLYKDGIVGANEIASLFCTCFTQGHCSLQYNVTQHEYTEDPVQWINDTQTTPDYDLATSTPMTTTIGGDTPPTKLETTLDPGKTTQVTTPKPIVGRAAERAFISLKLSLLLQLSQLY